jgi:hypothetical protein
MELIYKHVYGSEDILSGNIIIYKENSEYTLYAEFTVFDKKLLPNIKSIYKILTYEINEIVVNKEITGNDVANELLTIKYKIKILVTNNPKPEDLFIIDGY